MEYHEFLGEVLKRIMNNFFKDVKDFAMKSSRWEKIKIIYRTLKKLFF